MKLRTVGLAAMCGQSFLYTMREHGKLNDGQDNAYTAGIFLYIDRGLPAEDHSGGLFGYRTYLLRYPTQKFSVIVLCNRSDGNPDGLGRQVANMYLRDAIVVPRKLSKPAQTPKAQKSLHLSVKAPAPPVLTADQLEAFVGNYKSQETAAIYRVQMADGTLELRRGWSPPFKFVPVGVDRFHGDFLTLQFERDPAGLVKSIDVATPYTSHHPFDRVNQ